jgi:hypothetical protein
LLAFGCKKVFFKMDKTGKGIEVDLNNLDAVQELSFSGFT